MFRRLLCSAAVLLTLFGTAHAQDAQKQYNTYLQVKGTYDTECLPTPKLRVCESMEQRVPEMYADAMVASAMEQLDGTAPPLPNAGTPDQTYVEYCGAKRIASYGGCTSLRDKLAERRSAQELTRVATMSPDERARAVLAEKVAHWGLYARLMGKTWLVYTPGAADLTTVAYEWIVPGDSARKLEVGPGAARNVVEEMRLEMLGKDAVIHLVKVQSGLQGFSVFDTDGSIITQFGTEQWASDVQTDGSIRTRPQLKQKGTPFSYSFEDTATGRQKAMAALTREKQARAEAEDARRAAQRAKNDRFQNAMGALQNVIDQADQAYEATRPEPTTNVAASTYESDPGSDVTPGAQPPFGGSGGANGHAAGGSSNRTAEAGIAATLRRSTDGVHTSDASQAAAKPLRFVLDIGMLNKPGDTTNPTCYSNVITRPGPAGWGGRGFLPDGSAEQAHAEVQAMKAQFIEACERASGRQVTSEGNFHWTWNQTTDGDQHVSNAHARYREDVSVNL